MGWIWFQDAQYAIEKGDILAKFKNDTPWYDSKFMFIVNIDDYPYKIPYKENDTNIELITAFPAKKYKYFGSTQAN